MPRHMQMKKVFPPPNLALLYLLAPFRLLQLIHAKIIYHDVRRCGVSRLTRIPAWIRRHAVEPFDALSTVDLRVNGGAFSTLRWTYLRPLHGSFPLYVSLPLPPKITIANPLAPSLLFAPGPRSPILFSPRALVCERDRSRRNAVDLSFFMGVFSIISFFFRVFLRGFLISWC